MAEYIDREAALYVLRRYGNAPHMQGHNSIAQGMRIAVNSCIELLEELKTADVASVRHGRCKMNEWISVKDRLPDVETEVLAVCNRRADNG